MKIIEGDLLTAFDSGFDGIIHVANCQKTMNSGVARALREKWPQVYQADKDFFTIEARDRLGKITIADVADNRQVYNIYGQLNFGYDGKRYLSYDGLSQGLELVAENCKALQSKKVACPFRMGSDRAGGRWEIVSKIADCVFGDAGIEIVAFRI